MGNYSHITSTSGMGSSAPSEQPRSATPLGRAEPPRPVQASSNLRPSARTLFRHAARYWEPAGIAILAGAALWVGQVPNLDEALAIYFFDHRHVNFLFSDYWLWAELFDSGIKWLAVLLWNLLALLWLRSLFHPPRRADLKSWRAFLLFTVTASLLSLVLTFGLRNFSPHVCPAQLETFGGAAAYAPLSSPGPGSGGCFPSGHAAAAFMWIAAVYAGRRWKPEWFRRLLAVIALSGLTVGAAEILAGRHFLSQVLGTASICWFIPWAYAHWWPSKKPKTAFGQTAPLAGTAYPAPGRRAQAADSPSLIR